MITEAPVAEPEVEVQPALVPPDPDVSPPLEVDAPEQCGARHPQNGWICSKPSDHDLTTWHIDDDGHYWRDDE